MQTDTFTPKPAPAPAQQQDGGWKPVAVAPKGKPAPLPNRSGSSAAQQLINDLNAWGLGTLGQQIWKEWLTGTPVDQLLMNMRSSDAYKQRFPGMAELQKSGHAISEADYISKETADMSLMRAYGLPDQMVNNRNELGQLIANNVSTAELQSRLDAYKQVVLTLPQEVRDYAARVGINTGDLVGFWLNPDQSLPALQNKVAAAEVGGAAAQTGFGALDPQIAARLAGQGVDYTHALSGFTQATQLKGLTQQLPGQAGDVLSQADLVNATVGANGNSALAVQRVQQQRKAQFGDSQNYATTQAGAVGLAATDQP